MKRVYTTYWLVCCVFLFFQQPADMALAFSGAHTISKGSDPTTTTNIDIIVADIPDIMTDDLQDPLTSQCSDYEEYDGVECVCASNSSAHCTQDGGMVCDDQGGHYISKCEFALQTCQQTISLNRSLSSCGACAMLGLTGGKNYPHDATLAKFRRKGQSNGFSTSYQFIADSNIEVFYVREAGSWAIGRRNSSGSFIAMIQVLNGSYPEEANPGMLIPQQNGSWVVDSSYRLECIKEPETSHRVKRFILDEIKGHLLPDLKRDKNRFISTFGEPGKFTSTVDKIHHQILQIKDKIITIPDLHTQLNISVSSMVSLYSFILNDFSYLKTLLSDYDDWLDSVSKSAAQAVAMLPLDIMMSLPGLVAASASSLALVASGIGAVLAIAFGIVDLVSSVLEEKRVRDKLRDSKNKLISARRKLDSANKNMHQFQSKFCQFIVRFLYDLSNKGKPYDRNFSSLYHYITNTYGSSPDRCRDSHIVSKSNYATLHRLAYSYLAPLVSMLSHNVESLKTRIQEVKETNAFLEVIKHKVGQNIKPVEIFRFIKSNKPILTRKMFKNLFGFLKFISKSVLPKNSCYWGNDLENIRRGVITNQNYLQSPICNSNELASQVGIIKTGVQNRYIPCKITRQLDQMIFRSRYHVIRFIADNILPHETCYWGYDLNDIRGSKYVSVVNTATIDSGLLFTLQYLETGPPISLTRQIMHNKYGIDIDKWQTFILCHAWHNPDSFKQLGCTVHDGDTCYFDYKTYQSC